MATPSSLGSWDTPEHDELLLWISEHPEVIAEFIRPMMKDRFDSLFTKYRGPRFTYKTIQGYPVVGQNGYLHGKIDTIIEVHTELQQYNNRGKKTCPKRCCSINRRCQAKTLSYVSHSRPDKRIL